MVNFQNGFALIVALLLALVAFLTGYGYGLNRRRKPLASPPARPDFSHLPKPLPPAPAADTLRPYSDPDFLPMLKRVEVETIREELGRMGILSPLTEAELAALAEAGGHLPPGFWLRQYNGSAPRYFPYPEYWHPIPYGEAEALLSRDKKPVPAEFAPHLDDDDESPDETRRAQHVDRRLRLLVADLGPVLLAKLRRNEERYHFGNEWAIPDWADKLRAGLLSHIPKGVPLDVSIYSLFAWFHGWPTAVHPAPILAPMPEGTLLKLAEEGKYMPAGVWLRAIGGPGLNDARIWQDVPTFYPFPEALPFELTPGTAALIRTEQGLPTPPGVYGSGGPG